ncbi:hypothetical protein BTO06_08760 [Tenacibaculum sp. SZ-18]|uniref:hypothetical protein n=1 Tax=Tenacibaculum sp. SZ-18 TaxID=754423 RepID=UPI000C2D529E|nr:hypothetical protein [Tenacibaculum sp. SZ-18]AUC15222.1 hypothetical protein BTO06_08760 [Tenacibaculum sp. SZ-18]
MKKIIFSLVMLVGFALSTMTVQSSFAQENNGGTPITHENSQVGGGSGKVDCTATAECLWWDGNKYVKFGTVTCNAEGENAKCDSGFGWVKCDGKKSECDLN